MIITPDAITNPDSTDVPAAPSTQDPTEIDHLHVCFRCRGEMVYPLDWSEEGPRHWRIILRCPECESRREGVFEQQLVEQLDEELDRSAGVLHRGATEIAQANMSEEVEFFTRALEADLVVPSDF